MDNQFRWDMFLITQFYSDPDRKVFKVVFDFLNKNKMTFRDVYALKRTPLTPIHNFMSVSAFICCTMPVLGNTLLSRDVSDSFLIADKLAESNIDTVIDKTTNIDKKEKAILKKAEIDIDRGKLYSDYCKTQNAGNQWGVTK